MSIALKVWTSPKTSEVRVYVNAFNEYHEFAAVAAGRIWFGETEEGFIKIGGFTPCMSGRYGQAADAVFKAYRLEGMTWARLMELIELSQTKGGNFSEVRYFKILNEEEAKAALTS